MEDRLQEGRTTHHGGLTARGRRLLVYLRKCLSVAIESVILLAVTIVVHSGVLYGFKILWHLYLSTYMGQQFLQYYPQEAQETAKLLQMDLLHLSLRITLYAFVISFSIASFCRLLYASRYLHERFGIPGRVLFCGLPLTVLVAFCIQPLFEFRQWSTAFTVAILPTLFVFNSSFNNAAKLLPELNDLKKALAR